MPSRRSTYSLQSFLDGYIDAALWSSSMWSSSMDDMGNSFQHENYDKRDLAPSALSSMKKDCSDFVWDNKVDIVTFVDLYGSAQAGHDFWLTRNSHGAGFWDRGAGALGDRLTKAAHAYGESELYLGDDGKIYVS